MNAPVHNPAAEVPIQTDVIMLDYVGSAARGEAKYAVVAYDPARTVLYGQLLFSWPSWEDTVHVEHVEVDPAFRRRGVAMAMYETLYGFAAHEKVEVVHGMTTPEGGAALAAFRKRQESRNPKRGKKKGKHRSPGKRDQRSRFPNVLAPKGAARTWPVYAGTTSQGYDLWNYRGREIEIIPQPDGFMYVIIDPPVYGGGQLHIPQPTRSPDPAAALQAAVLKVDRNEAVNRRPELKMPYDAVWEAIEMVTHKGQPLTRANVTRQIEIWRTPKTSYRGQIVAEFNKLPLAERVELVDEMIRVAQSHGGKWPNPDRAQNVLAPKGPARPWPVYTGTTSQGHDLWLYRGREIEIAAEPGGYRWAILQPSSRGHGHHRIEQPTRSPDPQASLQAAVFKIDRLEAGMDRPELVGASSAVYQAIDKLLYEGQPLTRANVTRQIEIFRTPATTHGGKAAAAFYDLPMAERLELVDEMLRVADSHGFWPNPEREHNVVAPKGQLRPWPKWIGTNREGHDLWDYRDHEIQIVPLQDGRFRYGVALPGGGYFANTFAAADPNASLQAAVFEVDLLLVPDRPDIGMSGEEVDKAVRFVIVATHRVASSGKPIDRSTVARELEIFGRQPSLPNHAAAFKKLPVSERVELIDEVVRLAQGHGGKLPLSNPRLPNVVAPGGSGRPRPQYLYPTGGDVSRGSAWGYRGRVIEIHRQPQGGFAFTVWMQGRQGVMIQNLESPDEHTSLQGAVFHIDLEELATTRRDVFEAYLVVLHAMDELRKKKAPLDRATLARKIEEIRKDKRENMHAFAPKFYALPVQERVELLDEMIAVAKSNRGIFPT